MQFVEKFHFKEEFEDGETTSRINYHCFFNYQVDQSLMRFCSYREQLYDNFIRDHLTVKDGELRVLSLFQGHLLQNKDRVSKKLLELNDPAYD
jgi:hypothetical protein